MARRSVGARILRATGWSVLALVVITAGVLGGLLTAPFPTDATVKPQGAVRLLDARGIPYAAITPPETKIPVDSLNEVSACMQKAITAAEDERFFSHNGVDPLAIARALIADITHTGREQGGSTITQQYVKLVYTGSEKTKLRKVREAALAVRLEQRKSKQEILRLYLNAVNFGNGLVGVEAAALDYFGVHAKDLTCPQAAVLAGTVNAPTYNNPRYNGGASVTACNSQPCANSRKRYAYVIQRMTVRGDITPQQASDALRHLPTLKPPKDKTQPTRAPEYTDEVIAQVRQKLALGNDLFARGAITIKTPLDLDLQEAARKALATVLPDAKDPEAAIVAIDPRNGNVRALTTKRDGGYKRGGFDLATTAQRNSGSTVKPFTLAAALESGQFTVYSGLASQSVIDVPGCSPFKVQNAEPGEAGYYSLRSALEQSVNSIYAPLAVKVGLTKVRDTAVAAGIPASAFEGAGGSCPVYPAQSLGIGLVRPIDLTRGYATLSDGGVRHDLNWISGVSSADTGAALLGAPSDTGVQAIPKAVADQVVDVMRGVITRGTGTGARPPGLQIDLYGKTGTNDDFKDAWFVGCDPNLCIGVWMGYDDHTPMTNVEGSGEGFGGTLPARMFNLTLVNYAANRTRHKISALPSGSAGTYVPSFAPPLSTGPLPRSSPSRKGSGKSPATPTKGGASPVAPPSPVVPSTAAPPPSAAPPTSEAPPPAVSASP